MPAKPKSLFEIARLVVRTLAEKIAALQAAEYLAVRAARGDRGKFERVLARAPDAEPEERDRL